MDEQVATVLERLTDDLREQLAANLVGLYLHGSLVMGDFEPRRSDVDLLAVLAHDLSEADLQGLREMHACIAAAHPNWRDRVEVAYVPVATLQTIGVEGRPMARISPGEPLHAFPATRHYLLEWYVVRRSGLTLFGPPARELMPEISREEFVQVVREHARGWKAWVTETRGSGGQAYAVLTLCRALYSSRLGEQVSKRQAGIWASGQLHRWSALIAWALGWWYAGGSDVSGEDRHPEVTRFVEEVSDQVLSANP